jgi:hypothetical protein
MNPVRTSGRRAALVSRWERYTDARHASAPWRPLAHTGRFDVWLRDPGNGAAVLEARPANDAAAKALQGARPATAAQASGAENSPYSRSVAVGCTLDADPGWGQGPTGNVRLRRFEQPPASRPGAQPCAHVSALPGIHAHHCGFGTAFLRAHREPPQPRRRGLQVRFVQRPDLPQVRGEDVRRQSRRTGK